MKTTLMMLIMLFALTHTAFARPQFFILDSSQSGKTPQAFGYNITATSSGDNLHFSIDLSKKATLALRSASIFFHTAVPDKPRITVEIVPLNNSRKRIEFSLPRRYLQKCLLSIDSKILHPDHAMLMNFAGYRLWLETVPIESPQHPLQDHK